MTIKDFFDSKEKLGIHINSYCDYIKILYIFTYYGITLKDGTPYFKENPWRLYSDKLYLFNSRTYGDEEYVKESLTDYIESFEFIRDNKIDDYFYNKLVKIIEDNNLYHINNIDSFHAFIKTYDKFNIFNKDNLDDILDDGADCILNFCLDKYKNLSKESYKKIYKLNFDDTPIASIPLKGVDMVYTYDDGKPITFKGGFLKSIKPVEFDGVKDFEDMKKELIGDSFGISDIFWIDDKGKTYKKDDIDNTYLRNIALWLLNKKRPSKFIDGVVLYNIYTECKIRKIFKPELCLEMLKEAVNLYDAHDYSLKEEFEKYIAKVPFEWDEEWTEV